MKKPDEKRLGKVRPIERPHQLKQVWEMFYLTSRVSPEIVFKFKGAVLLIDQAEMDDGTEGRKVKERMMMD